MKTIQIILIGVALFSGSKLSAQSAIIEQESRFFLSKPIQETARVFLEDTLMKSLSVAIHYKGEDIIYHFGELDQDTGNKPNDKTIYEIGSVSKTFIGTLVAIAELEGKLSIEDNVSKYLEGDYSNLQFENTHIKIKHLITHSSSLPQYLPLSILDEFNIRDERLPHRIADKANGYSKNKFFTDLKDVILDTLPGVRYAYSDVGVELTCHILESIYGIPLEKLLKQKLFDKANMTSTGLKLSGHQEKFYANGYGDYNTLNPSKNGALWGGSGDGKSTMPDLLHYMKYHLSNNEAVKKSHQVLFEKDIIYGDPRNKMGYAWFLSRDGDFGQYINHHGGGFRSQIWMMLYPEEQIGISVVTNQSGARTAGKLYHVVNQILNEIAKEKYKSDKTEIEQITETLMDYIEGSTNGQPIRLKKAFHSDLNLYYIRNREFSVWSGENYIEGTREGEPTGEIGEILSIDFENDIATSKIRISHPESNTPYIDYLMLIKVNGHWKIVHKMFTQEIETRANK